MTLRECLALDGDHCGSHKHTHTQRQTVSILCRLKCFCRSSSSSSVISSSSTNHRAGAIINFCVYLQVCGRAGRLASSAQARRGSNEPSIDFAGKGERERRNSGEDEEDTGSVSSSHSHRNRNRQIFFSFSVHCFPSFYYSLGIFSSLSLPNGAFHHLLLLLFTASSSLH